MAEALPFLISSFAADRTAASLLAGLGMPASPIDEAERRLARGEPPDAVVVAVDMRKWAQVQRVRSICDCSPRAAVIVVDLGGDRDAAVRCIADGAQDCIEAEGLTEGLLMRAVRHAVARVRRSDTLAERLHATEQELERVGRSLADAQRIAQLGAWDWHIESGRLWWSDEIYRIFGVDPGEFPATYEAFLRHVHPDDRASLEETVMRAVQTVQPYDLQHRIIRPDGSERVVHERGDLVLGSDGRPERLVGTVHDVTERAEAETTLRRAHDELEQRVRERTEKLNAEIINRRHAQQVLKTSEARMRLVADAMPALIAYLDHQQHYLFANARYRDWFGYFPEDATGRHMRDVIGSQFYGELQPMIEAVLDGHEVKHEGWLQLPSGQKRFYLATFLPHYTAEGDCQGFFSLIQDITERKRSEEALRRSEIKYRALMNDAADAILLTDMEGVLLEANRRAEELLGMKEGELTGHRFSELFVEAPGREVVGLALDALVCSGLAEVADVLVCGRKEPIPVDIALSAIEIGDQRVYQAILKDISPHKQAEEQLRAAKEAAELADRAKSEFLANMSHELRTPLNAIIGFSDIMRNEMMGPVGSDHYRDYVGDIYESGRHLLEVINEVLDMSKIESGNLELHAEWVDLSDLVRASCRLVGERAMTAKVDLRIELDDRLPRVEVDERRFKQILLNLLSNAVKFTPAGGRVSVLAEPGEDGTLAVLVRDTGIGMSDADMEKALAPFGQVDSSLSRKYDGTGLGLPLAKAFVELHDGELRLESAPGAGTTVRIVLPPTRVGERLAVPAEV